jgi:catechol 2,3-dioxygenase-like lactoylglutathione lyase family enzyme
METTMNRQYAKQLTGRYIKTAVAVTALMVISLYKISVAQSYQTSEKMKKSESPAATTVSVRYIVNDVDASVTFYKDFLGFDVVMHPAPGFAMLSLGNLRLLLNKPGAGGAGQAMPDGTLPAPGGWNRIQVEVEDLDATIKTLKTKGARFRNDLVAGNGGKQILISDPSGNLIELFEPKR